MKTVLHISGESFQLSVNFNKNEPNSKFKSPKIHYLNFGEDDQMVRQLISSNPKKLLFIK